jgi:hypothetical protein
VFRFSGYDCLEEPNASHAEARAALDGLDLAVRDRAARRLLRGETASITITWRVIARDGERP